MSFSRNALSGVVCYTAVFFYKKRLCSRLLAVRSKESWLHWQATSAVISVTDVNKRDRSMLFVHKYNAIT